MKKIICTFCFLTLIFSLFAEEVDWDSFEEEKNFVESQVFDVEVINEIDIHLIYEKIQIEKIYGKEVLLEIYSNNNSLLPEVKFQKGKLSIMGNKKKHTKGDFCKIILYLPQENNCEQMSLAVKNYDLNLFDLKIGSLMIKVEEANINIRGLKVDFLDCKSKSGNIFLQLEEAILGKSEIFSNKGEILLEIYDDLQMELLLYSSKGDVKYKRDVFTKKEDVSQLIIENIYGNITIDVKKRGE